MGVGIGAAGDYYRVRVTHLDGVDSPDFEWREDILYRRPEVAAPKEYEAYRVEAVALDDEEDVTTLGMFDDSRDAYEALDAATGDLATSTRSEFEEQYFPADV
jgi:hypothetical protein